jgi:undecaprenyl-diphosphatase
MNRGENSIGTPRVVAVTTNDRRSAERISHAWLLLAILGFVAFAIVTGLVAARVTFWFDQPLLDLMRNLGGLAPLWNFISDASNYPMIAVGVGIVLWLLRAHRRREALLVIVVLAAATAGSELVKLLIARPRPAQTLVEGVVYSYPSGHVLEALSIFGIIGLLIWRSASPRWLRVGVNLVFGVLVVLVGIARIALAAHYPSDVLGGAIVGIAVLATFAWLTSRHAPVTPPEPS